MIFRKFDAKNNFLNYIVCLVRRRANGMEVNVKEPHIFATTCFHYYFYMCVVCVCRNRTLHYLVDQARKFRFFVDELTI